MTEEVLAIRARECARLLSVSQQTVRIWAQDGIIPAVQIGNGKRKLLLFPVALIKEWLANGSMPVKGN